MHVNNSNDDFGDKLNIKVRSSVNLFSAKFNTIECLNLWVTSNNSRYDVSLDGGTIHLFNCDAEKYYSQPAKIHTTKYKDFIGPEFLEKYNIDYVYCDIKRLYLDDFPVDKIMFSEGTYKDIKKGSKVDILKHTFSNPMQHKFIDHYSVSLDGLQNMQIDELYINVFTQETINALEYIQCKQLQLYSDDYNHKRYDISPILRNKYIKSLNIYEVAVFEPALQDISLHFLDYREEFINDEKIYNIIEQNRVKHYKELYKIVIGEDFVE